MLSIILTWCVILLFSYISGVTTLHMLYGFRSETSENPSLLGIDECIWSGTVFLAIYAQSFSLFHRVGTIAFIFLSVIIIVLSIYSAAKCRYTIQAHIKNIKNLSSFNWLLLIIVMIAMISWTNTVPENYDTYLYHNQSIQWLERYGVIKGLGNLHCRFAYNSSFLPIQALFSFRGLTGQSLHTVNGFYCAFSLIYCLITNNLLKKEKPGLSDYLKIASMVYVCFSIPWASSPCTDTPALILFLYICIKWNDSPVSSEIATDKYAMLCMLSIFDVTLKLSTAPCVLLTIYPVVNYIRQKNHKMITIHVLTGFLIALPWLVRNVIISGYLIYPYAQIDLFNVDWKIPSSVAYIDSWKIQVRSKGYTDIAMRSAHVWDWFPGVWFAKDPGWFERFCMISGIILSVMLFIYLCFKLIKKDLDFSLHLFYLLILISFYIWFTTAPTIRYGMVFSFALLSIWLYILSGIDHTYIRYLTSVIKSIVYLYSALMFVYTAGNWIHLSEQPLILQKDYDHIETRGQQYHDFIIWYPTGDWDLCGCDVFPSLPYPKMVDLLEMRGNSINDGFRVKSEYIDKMIDMSGDIYEYE